MKKNIKGFTKINSLKTHCPRGHRLEGNNLIKYALEHGKRSCRICRNKRAKIFQQKPDIKKRKLEWARNNTDKINKYNKAWRNENKEYFINWEIQNKEKRKIINKRFNTTPERIQYHKDWERKKYHNNSEYKTKKLTQNKEWRIENPRSGAGLPYDEQMSMMETRVRFNNTCKWLGCGKTSRETSIHVHHLLPKEEYPEFAAISQYQITYCQEHHALWHKARGDKYWKWILSRGY